MKCQGALRVPEPVLGNREFLPVGALFAQFFNLSRVFFSSQGRVLY